MDSMSVAISRILRNVFLPFIGVSQVPSQPTMLAEPERFSEILII